MPAVKVESAKKVIVKVSEKVANPEPGKGAEGDFQRAGPVDADGVRVFALTVIPLRPQLPGEAVVFSQPPGFGKGDKVLVAVQFPDDFVIANLIEIEERNLVPGLARGAFVVHGVEMPVDRRTEVEAFVP